MLTGGDGADTFNFNLPTDGSDTITDFVSGTDHLVIWEAGFGAGLSPGATPTLLSAADGLALNNPGSDGYFIFDNDGADAGTLYWDGTGDSSSDAVAVAVLTGVTVLHPTDMLLV